MDHDSATEESQRRGPRVAQQSDDAKVQALIQRIAVVSQYAVLLEEQLRGAGITPVREPRADAAKTQALADGIVAQLQTAQAELRIAHEAMEAQARRIEALEAELVRQRVSDASVGHSGSAARRREAPPTPEIEDDHDLHPTDHEPEEGEPEDPPPAPAPAEPKRRPGRAKALVEPKAADPEAIDAIAHRLLVARGSSASTSFLTRSICDLGRAVTAAEVDAALTRLGAAKRVVQASALCGIAMWRAT